MSICLEENNRVELSPVHHKWNNFPSCLVPGTSIFHVWHAQKVSNLHPLSRSRCFDFEELLAHLIKLQTYIWRSVIESNNHRFQWDGFQDRLTPSVPTLHILWRKARELNSKGAINARRISSEVPSPIGLAFHYSYRLIKSFPYLSFTYTSIGSKSFSYNTVTSGFASNFANHCSVLNPLTSVIVPSTIKSGM